MKRKGSTLLLLGTLLSASALAQSPGPTDPSGPRLEPPSPPRTGTEMTDPAMDEQIERGTVIDRKDVLRDDTSPPDPSPGDADPMQSPGPADRQ